jgi:UDP:flavonoid glycosyltransferase YjiC (YdhE family)
LVTPIAVDQFDSAARVAERGLARWMRGDPSDAGALDATLRDAALADGVRRVARQLAAAPDGAADAAELIAAVG